MITTINEFKFFLEGKRSDAQYKKEVALYKFFVVNTKTKKVESGFEYKEDAKDALSDFDGDKDYKVLSELQLKKLGIENPKQKWINESLKSNIDKEIEDLKNKLKKLPKKKLPKGGGNFSSNSEEGIANRKLEKQEQNIKNKIEKLEKSRKKNLNESTEQPRMMSFIIPEKKDWIEMGDNLGIKYMGKNYWIKTNDKNFFEENIGKTISFKYFPNAMYIEIPKILN